METWPGSPYPLGATFAGTGFGRAIGVFLNGDGIGGRDARGGRITDDNFVLYFNAHDDVIDFTMPDERYSSDWEIVVDTDGAAADSAPVKAGQTVPIAAKSMAVLRAYTIPEAEPDH